MNHAVLLFFSSLIQHLKNICPYASCNLRMYIPQGPEYVFISKSQTLSAWHIVGT